MSKNNTIRKSDKKFIRTEKARIRRTFLDVKKQQELIDGLYKKFVPIPKESRILDKVGKPKTEVKEVKEVKVKKEKVVKNAK